MFLLGQEYGAVIEQIRIWVVSVDEKNFRDISSAWPALDVDHHIERIGDVGLNRPVRQLNAALQDTACEPCKPLLRRVRMNSG